MNCRLCAFGYNTGTDFSLQTRSRRLIDRFGIASRPAGVPANGQPVWILEQRNRQTDERAAGAQLKGGRAMTNQASAAENDSRKFALSLGLACYLIAMLLWRAFTVAHEYPMRTEQVVTMAIDGLAIAALIGLRASLPKWLFGIALLCGLALFAIRLNGDASWWTGHIMYALPSR